jgi:hypothetical protein
LGSFPAVFEVLPWRLWARLLELRVRSYRQ